MNKFEMYLEKLKKAGDAIPEELGEEACDFTQAIYNLFKVFNKDHNLEINIVQSLIDIVECNLMLTYLEKDDPNVIRLTKKDVLNKLKELMQE